jgi:hypothetical protein
MPSSGGYIADNFRQGFRAEYLAKYIMSEFGPCERVNPENDYGLDLIATVMKKVGSGGYVSSMYGIQVKAGTARFHYSGEQLMDWIKAYNIPILMCRADRASGSIKLYSTWTLHHLILDGNSAHVQIIDFIENYGEQQKLRMPEIQGNTGTVWLGPPIIHISSAELHQVDLIDEIRKTLTEWISIDTRNYFRRKADIPIVYGYLTWETNKSLDASQRTWYKPYFYSWSHTNSAMKLIQECATLIALNQGKDSEIARDLAEIIKKHGVDVPAFTREALAIDSP